MTENIKDSKRMELICEFIKTGKQPEGYKITETKTGKYRVTKVKPEKELLEEKRKRLQKAIDGINEQLKKLDNPTDEKPAEE